MTGNERVLAVIVARGGSKRLPRKNILDLSGKPLIAWSIEAAKSASLIDLAIVSTDDAEIGHVAAQWGGNVPFLRPAEFATDTSPLVETILHAVEHTAGNYSHVVLLQASSPLRRGSDIDGALRLCRQKAAPACISVSPAPKARWTFEMTPGGTLSPVCADKAAELYQPNGAVYVGEWEWLKRHRDFYSPETVGYVMPPERSVDIDTMQDLVLARALLKEQH